MYTNVHMCIFHKCFVVFIYNVQFFYDPLKIIKCCHKCFISFKTNTSSLNCIHLIGKPRSGRKCPTQHNNKIDRSRIGVLTLNSSKLQDPAYWPPKSSWPNQQPASPLSPPWPALEVRKWELWENILGFANTWCSDQGRENREGGAEVSGVKVKSRAAREQGLFSRSGAGSPELQSSRN